MLHSAETDLPEDRKLALFSDLKDLVQDHKLYQLIYNESSLLQIDAGHPIYKQGDIAPRSVYFVTRGGVLEKRDEAS